MNKVLLDLYTTVEFQGQSGLCTPAYCGLSNRSVQGAEIKSSDGRCNESPLAIAHRRSRPAQTAQKGPAEIPCCHPCRLSWPGLARHLASASVSPYGSLEARRPLKGPCKIPACVSRFFSVDFDYVVVDCASRAAIRHEISCASLHMSAKKMNYLACFAAEGRWCNSCGESSSPCRWHGA